MNKIVNALSGKVEWRRISAERCIQRRFNVSFRPHNKHIVAMWLESHGFPINWEYSALFVLTALGTAVNMFAIVRRVWWRPWISLSTFWSSSKYFAGVRQKVRQLRRGRLADYGSEGVVEMHCNRRLKVCCIPPGVSLILPNKWGSLPLNPFNFTSNQIATKYRDLTSLGNMYSILPGL